MENFMEKELVTLTVEIERINADLEILSQQRTYSNYQAKRPEWNIWGDQPKKHRADYQNKLDMESTK
uniref:Phage protein n=1 Tax=Loa loa TaxID=7209 RepID=A0A1I7VGN9_LOALO